MVGSDIKSLKRTPEDYMRLDLPITKTAENGETLYLTVGCNYANKSKIIGKCTAVSRPENCTCGCVSAHLTKRLVEHHKCIRCEHLEKDLSRSYWADKFTRAEIEAMEQTFRTIDGSFCKATQKIGYCKCDLHKGALTKKLMDQHECLEKDCVWFEKHQNAPYWKQKDAQKEARKNGKAYKKMVATREQEYLRRIREATQNDPNFYALDVKQDGCTYVVRIIHFQLIDYPHYINILKPLCDGAQLKFNSVKTTNERKREIIAKYGLVKIPEQSIFKRKDIVEEITEEQLDIVTIDDNDLIQEEIVCESYELEPSFVIEEDSNSNIALETEDSFKEVEVHKTVKLTPFQRFRLKLAACLLKGLPGDALKF